MPTRLRSGAVLTVLLALVSSGVVRAQGLEYVRANYTKYECRIPMRDGVRLFTSVYVPKDASTPHPIVMTRTPYSVGPYGIDRYRDSLGPSPIFGRSGYIVAYQDVRGRYLSEGTFVDVRPQIPEKKGPQDIDESSDTYDTIEWLVKHVPNNNGRVGIWGISYPGFYAAAAMIDAHPALKAVSPQAPLVDWFLGDDFHHNGAFFLVQCFNFYADFGVPRPEPTSKKVTPFEHGTPDPYEFFLRIGPLPRADERYYHGERKFWLQMMDHGTYDDFWKKRALWRHFKDVRPAVQTVGGWFDAEDLYGPLKTYRTVEANGHRSQNKLVIGPWVHGGWSGGDGSSLGAVNFGSKTGEFFRDKIQFPFFDLHLSNAAADGERLEKMPPSPEMERLRKIGAKPAAAWIFETGRNEWHEYDAWPPKDATPKTLYLRDGGKLAFEPPAKAGGQDYDEFPSDPAKPVPYTQAIAQDYPPAFMVEDQRFAARRPDVLVYQTDPLNEDLRVAGPIGARLHVATTGTDADWVVKLIDVYPDDLKPEGANQSGVTMGGYQQLVRADVFRGKFRESFERPEPFKPGEPTVVPMTIPDTHHTFRPGHRVMVQIQCSWFPLVDRNPQKLVDIYHAKEADFRRAEQRVYRSADRATRLDILVLP